MLGKKWILARSKRIFARYEINICLIKNLFLLCNFIHYRTVLFLNFGHMSWKNTFFGESNLCINCVRQLFHGLPQY